MEDGDGLVHPTAESAALLNYTGWTSDGQVFDTTQSRGRPTMIPLDRVMPAFRECVEQMVVGERRRCWIPATVSKGNWGGRSSRRPSLRYRIDGYHDRKRRRDFGTHYSQRIDWFFREPLVKSGDSPLFFLVVYDPQVTSEIIAA